MSKKTLKQVSLIRDFCNPVIDYNISKSISYSQTLAYNTCPHQWALKYVKGLQEQVQILKELKDINEKIIQVKDEHITELQTKVDELLNLLSEATSLMQHRLLTFNNEQRAEVYKKGWDESAEFIMSQI